MQNRANPKQGIKSITAMELSEMSWQKVDLSKLCYLYFIGAWIDDNLIAVKIGISKDCEQRLKDLQSHTFADLSIIGCYTYSSVELARELEKEAHKVLKEYRIRGEWFKAESKVVNYHPIFVS